MDHQHEFFCHHQAMAASSCFQQQQQQPPPPLALPLQQQQQQQQPHHQLEAGQSISFQAAAAAAVDNQTQLARTNCTAPDRSTSISIGSTIISSGSSNRRKKTRTMFSNYQLGMLESTFQQSPYPDAYTRKELANRLALDETRVQVWFQNRRAKWRKKAVTAGNTNPNSMNAQAAHNSGSGSSSSTGQQQQINNMLDMRAQL